MSQQPRTTLHPITSTTTAPSTSGSQTILQTTPQQPSATLHLRGSTRPETTSDTSSRVRWATDVVDNEGMGKKSSKVCCIYHKPKEPGESGSEEDSSSSSDGSDSEPDLSRARKAGKGRKEKGHGPGGEGAGKGKGKEAERKPSPNAYERLPKHAQKKAG
ncbi:hypothetical protein LTR62_007356 [Meristemomyces frigidus]|uniref:Type 1 phosphatases regulator n=1 Tax=Meristemomyces frigidus TaxID=1508187 RepID=A0AAN7TQ15_9PEZI|nr:hypothetical protein LTR62_007356 [Meristemomyces frigidus]